jgi:HAMP domain-containing protein
VALTWAGLTQAGWFLPIAGWNLWLMALAAACLIFAALNFWLAAQHHRLARLYSVVEVNWYSGRPSVALAAEAAADRLIYR